MDVADYVPAVADSLHWLAMDKVARLRGTMIHRSVLHIAGKWLTVDRRFHAKLRAEAMWMAAALTDALKADDGAWISALVDPGGPHWNAFLGDYRSLPPTVRSAVYAPIDVPVKAAVAALAEMARVDGWSEIRSEVDSPTAYLAATSEEEREAAKLRCDLLVRRSRTPVPLIVELKTGTMSVGAGTLESFRQNTLRMYALPLSQAIGRPVQHRVLYVTFAGKTQWSPLRSTRGRGAVVRGARS